MRRWGCEATPAEKASYYTRATVQFLRHDCGGRMGEDWEEPQRLPAGSYGGVPRGRGRHQDAEGGQLRCGCARAALSPSRPTLTNNTSHVSLDIMQVRCILFYQIHGRLGPSEKGPTPSHELESSVGPRAIEVESTPIPLPTPDLDDGPPCTVHKPPRGGSRPPPAEGAAQTAARWRPWRVAPAGTDAATRGGRWAPRRGRWQAAPSSQIGCPRTNALFCPVLVRIASTGRIDIRQPQRSAVVR